MASGDRATDDAPAVDATLEGEPLEDLEPDVDEAADVQGGRWIDRARSR